MKSPGGIAPETTNARTWTAMQRGSRPSQTSLPISTASSPRTASGVHTSARLRWRDRPDQQQRMELTAPMMALEALTRPVVVHLYTDSTYVRNASPSGFSAGSAGWKAAAKQPVKNGTESSGSG